MAGRAEVEKEDNYQNERILVLNKQNKWEVAKEPLHYYEKDKLGLDCGMQFAKNIIEGIDNDNIIIGLVPLAVGGSSIENWLKDDRHRGVQLLSNYREKSLVARKYGEQKVILWLQGENNANRKGYINYDKKLDSLITNFRFLANDDGLPVIIGKINSKRKYNVYYDSINLVIQNFVDNDKNAYCIETKDFTFMTDGIHFDARSTRKLGDRYSQIFLNKIRQE